MRHLQLGITWLFTIAMAYVVGVHVGTVTTLVERMQDDLERTFKRKGGTAGFAPSSESDA